MRDELLQQYLLRGRIMPPPSGTQNGYLHRSALIAEKVRSHRVNEPLWPKPITVEFGAFQLPHRHDGRIIGHGSHRKLGHVRLPDIQTKVMSEIGVVEIL